MTDDLVKRLGDSAVHSYLGRSLMKEAADRIEQLTAERDRLRASAIALRDDMMERSQLRIDAINGEQYRIVNAGAGVWMDFCAALKGETP